MKLGVIGLLPADWRSIDRAATQRVHAAGFRGAQLHIPEPLRADPEEVRGVKRAFIEADLEIAQVNGDYGCLVSADASIRDQAIHGLQALCRIGAITEAASVFVRPGSLNPRGPWFPHPDNHSTEAFDRLVGSLRKVCLTAQEEGVLLAIEGHVLSPLDSARRIRDLLAAVGSPFLRFNADPVNYIGSVSDAYDTARVINELFDVLGKDTVSAHAKDCQLAEELVLHISEAAPGSGTMDYSVFLRRFEESCPDGFILIEHLPDKAIPQARKAILKVVESLGISLLT
jgi:sugar phosphate isomerase/epimerase